MIDRYEDPRIAEIWADRAKVARWDEVELAVMKAREKLGLITLAQYEQVEGALGANPCDLDWWRARDRQIGHDLNAYLDERRRHLPAEVQHLFHQDMTSYDTEEPAFALALLTSLGVVDDELDQLQIILREQAGRYRFLPFLDRTHGQWAKLRSFGARILTWMGELFEVRQQLACAYDSCNQSRISGAIGNYGGKMSPKIELEALRILSLKPFYGATQILPRVIYVSLAQGLARVAAAVAKAGLDIRLGARSGMPICHEPFGKHQKGSSAMPHKRNTIRTEQMQGMVWLVQANAHAIEQTISTWEARAIEQSCVERVAWPDLFHEVLRVVTVMQSVLRELVVYPDNMLREIVESRGTYASDEAKNFLAELLAARGIDAEVAYRIVQLASFCAFQPEDFWARARDTVPASLEKAEELFDEAYSADPPQAESIQELIRTGTFWGVPELEVSEVQAEEWSKIVGEIFANVEICDRWNKLFRISYLLRQEEFLFEQFGL